MTERVRKGLSRPEEQAGGSGPRGGEVRVKPHAGVKRSEKQIRGKGRVCWI